MAFSTLAAASWYCFSSPESQARVSGTMTLALLQSSSCCMNDTFCSDIYLSLSASLNALAAGSLPCSLQREVEPPGALPCQWPGNPPPRPTRPPCQALIREGGGYN